MTQTSSKWLQRPPSHLGTSRVFCVPHAGCGVGIFRNWPVQNGDVEFVAVDLPGRLTRFADLMPSTFQELAAQMADGLEQYLDTPFAVFGHCWAALAGYELAIHLERTGRPTPTRLFVSSQLPPQDDMIARMLAMTESELAEELEKVVRDMGQKPHPELMEIYLGILSADLDMIKRYEPSEPTSMPCPVTAIGWRDDTEVTPEQMAGWSACPDTTFVTLEGAHDRFIAAPSELMDELT